ncbi:MAG: HD domain-containing protein [Bacteroidales bacterium]|nr:HD domain-containing protein [Bacteroidales bacterium]
MENCLNVPVFEIISDIAAEKNLKAFVIGGFVRDCLLRRNSKDIDIVVLGSGIDFAEKVARRLGRKKLSIFKNFGTAMLKTGDLEVEFVGARKESYNRNSRKPVVEDGSLEDDQNRRDFTINAMAISLNKEDYGRLVDPFNGITDLEKKIIRTPLDPSTTFSDDPLRMMRAIRFASQLNFRIDDVCFASIRENKERLKIVSAERITDELNKIVLSPKPSAGFIMMETTGILQLIFPEFQALKGVDEEGGQKHKDNFYHTLKVLDNISLVTDSLWLRWAAVLHDIAKPLTKKYEPGLGWTFHGHEFLGYKMVPSIFRRLKLPLHESMHYVQKLVLLHLRPIVLSQEIVTDSAIRRLLFDAGEDIDDLMTLCEADITSKNPQTVKKHLANFKKVREKMAELEARDSIRNFQPPISGDNIQLVFNIPPCREIGTIKNFLKDAILDGIIPNNFDAAWEHMIEKGKELGLTPHLSKEDILRIENQNGTIESPSPSKP